MRSNEKPNSYDPEGQGSEDTQPSQEITQRDLESRQGIISPPDRKLIFAHVLFASCLQQCKVCRLKSRL
jgi:hypothetical protein